MSPILTMRLVLCLSLCILAGSALAARNPNAPDTTATLVYDPAGNVASRTTILGTTTYTYDQLNRLTAESGPAGSFTYHYDPDGVRLSDSKNSYTYSTTSNRLTSRNGVAVTTDAAGNITNDGLGHTYVYNQAGQLSQVQRGATVIANYYYNYLGQRTRKTTTAAAPQGAATVIYHYDEWNHLIAETTGGGAPIRTYVWADDKLYVQIDHVPTKKIIYFELDHLGTPRAALNQSGAVVWTWESDAFGAIQPNQNPSGLGVEVVNLRFPGQYFDQETGLYYNMHRYYDSTMGQYTQSDPIGLYGSGLKGGSWSTYTYVNGNPLRYVDSRGTNPIAGAIEGGEVGSVFGPIGTVVGAVVGAAGGYLIADQLGNLIFAKPGNESRPTDAPTGTIPVDQSGLGRGDVHDIKDGIGAGAKDWTGITPNGDVITSNPDGSSVNHGPADQFTNRPTGLCGSK